MTARGVTRSLAVLVVACGLLAPPSQATPIVTISTTTPVVSVGDPVEIHVDAAFGPGEEVGFFDLVVSFDPALVAAIAKNLDPGNKVKVPGHQIFFDDFLPASYSGAVDVGPLTDEATLEANQGTGFRLVDLTFMATALGTAIFPVDTADIVSFDGRTMTNASGGRVSVLVSVPSAPEPATLLLIGTGLALAARRYKRLRQ